MDTKTPHLLLVEDDPITAHFFQTVLSPLPTKLDWARSCNQALNEVQHAAYNVWLIDLHLPDGTGLELLSRLRARHSAVPALAHTAELNLESKQALEQAGFVDILIKPFSAQTLLGAVQRVLLNATDDVLTHWDETAALKALGGQIQHVHTLRQLFLAELPATRNAVYQALEQDDQASLQAYLHRLKASCGFVGAVQLEQATRQLQRNTQCNLTRHYFDKAICALLH